MFSEWNIAHIVAVVGSAIAIVTLVKGLYEYSKQSALKRAEHFYALRKRLYEFIDYRKICDMLDRDDPALSETPIHDRFIFLGLFEEVALSINSGLLRASVAHYMFGYYALRCLDSKNFWKDIERESIYWSLFKNLFFTMKYMEASSISLEPARLRL